MSQHRKKRRPFIRLLTVALALFTGWHIFASFLWIAPYSPLREVVPGNALQNYMIPMFGQSWSVFAPEPINGDYQFRVRAVTEEDGEETVTEWVNATEVELSMIQYNLFPPRAGIQSSEVSSQLKGSYDKLNADHKVVAELNYFKDDWGERLEEKLKSYGDEDEAEAYLAKEQQALAYATQVAYAMWGEENVLRIQYESSRQNVIPFASRHDPEAERPAKQIVDIGWRGTVVREGQNNQSFSDTFVRQYNKIQKETAQ